MFGIDKKYLFLVGFHVLLGALFFAVNSFSKPYSLLVLVVGTYYIFKNRNANDEALLAAAYAVGCEVMMRMTGGAVLYEFGKYSVIFFLLFGTYYTGFSKNGVVYWIFLLLLVPGIVIATQTLSENVDMRKTIIFNVSGPVSLSIAALYCYSRKISFDQFQNILLCLGLPVITVAIYLMIFTPDIRESVTGTGSNFATSGGFGPNQVSTMLGLGMFIFISRVIFKSPNLPIVIFNLAIAILIGFRGLVTFSRGGMITSVIMILLLAFVIFSKTNSRGRQKMTMVVVFGTISFVAIWTYSSVLTGGLIEKRYNNQDAAGRVKESQSSGRGEIAETEINSFLDSPFLGIGVGRGADLRADSEGTSLSHSEITRMLAEHGSLGILGLLILCITPIVLYADNKQHFFLLSMLIFWLLTINHAAMRLAAPGFVYALSILKVTYLETPAVHRE
ncbi:MAG: O-antigen ligase domain-containing protein [Flavobacterium sp.]|uniref:O-antigen ligase family protein n=1 Tax=Flavobacterium sp. TaxID=239 RepID=UPI0012187DFE|nr:O-antigen ligase family protein [Flavobacterium sp.]RZJ66091.1 MAG: O-antigen ligase domain-containing protein [Flavobacterium sp.]